MYFGIGDAVFGPRPPVLVFPSQPWLGGAIIMLATALVASALLVFRSWRLTARIEAGHELCTAGPFGLVRHPIYLATALLNLGTFLWIPTWLVAAGAVVSVAMAERRARAEERLLLAAFGDAYRDYAARVKRFLPGIY
jgi:protein-S-isoprenylcysteine O-methyltransferase Ste14